MNLFNIIIRKKDNSIVTDFSSNWVVSAELTSGNYIIKYTYPGDDTVMTATFSETDYVMYGVPKYEHVDD